MVGYDVDLIEHFTKSLGVEAEIIDTQWSGIILSLYANRFEIIMSSMSYTKERLAKVLFSIPYAEASPALLIRTGDKGAIKTIEDLSGRMLGVQLGSPGEVMRPAMDEQIKAARGEGFKGHKTYDDHRFLAARGRLPDGDSGRRPRPGSGRRHRIARAGQEGRSRRLRLPSCPPDAGHGRAGQPGPRGPGERRRDGHRRRRVVVEDGRAVLVDQDEVRLQAAEAARQLWIRARG